MLEVVYTRNKWKAREKSKEILKPNDKENYKGPIYRQQSFLETSNRLKGLNN